MNAEIICVGTELLLGDVVNTNATYIAKHLAQLGINCYAQIVVGDNPKRLAEAIKTSAEKADLIIVTGGLGPTYDDLTKETVADYFNKKLILDERSLQRIEAIFQKRKRKMTSNNKKQAMIPEGAIVLDNNAGTAPGVIIEGEQTTAIMLPGPPKEMSAMFTESVLPYLQKQSNTILISHTVHLLGIGESQVELLLHDYMLEMQNPTIAPYAKEGEMYLRITAAAENAMLGEQLIQPVIEKLQTMFGEYIYGIDADSLQAVVVQTLQAQQKTIFVAENITGGYLLSSLNSCVVPPQATIQGNVIANIATEQELQMIATDYQKNLTTDLGIILSGNYNETEQCISPQFSIAIITPTIIQIETLEVGFGYEHEPNRIRSLAVLQGMRAILENIK